MKVLLLRMKRTGGTLTFRDNLISLKNGLQRKEKDWEVVTKLKEIVFVPGSPWDWANEEHQAILIEEHVPNHLTLRIPKIKQVMDIISKSMSSWSLTENYWYIISSFLSSLWLRRKKCFYKELESNYNYYI